MKNKFATCVLILLVPFVLWGCSDENLPNSAQPTLSLNEATNITQTSATLSGVVNTNGSVVKECEFLYSTAQSDLTASSSFAKRKKASSTSGNLQATVDDLQAGTVYYYCLLVSSGLTSMISSIQSFTTFPPNAPVLEKLEILEVDGVSITAQWTLKDNGGYPLTSMGLKYQKKGESSISTLEMEDFDKNGVNVAYTLKIENLNPGTEYVVWAYAESEAKVTGTSKDITAKTQSLETPVLDIKILGKTGDSVVACGTLVSIGKGSVVTMGFEYNKVGDSNVTFIPISKFDSGSTNTFTLTIEGLQSGVSYEIRATATNELGSGYSETQTVTTEAVNVPELTVSVLKKETYSLTVQGALITDGGTKVTEHGIEYRKLGESTFNRIVVDKFDIGSNDKTFSCVIGNLRPITDYEIRAYATNNGVTGFSEIQIATTEDFAGPVVTTHEIRSEDISLTSIKARGTIVSTGEGTEITEKGFCYSATNPNPDMNDEVIKLGSGNGSFEQTISGLKFDATYYVRAYAKTVVEGRTLIGYGEVRICTTVALTSGDVPKLSKPYMTDVDFFSFSVKASVSSAEGLKVVEVGFCLTKDPEESAESAYKNHRVAVTSWNGSSIFSTEITNLDSRGVYYVYAYAINEAGIGFGEKLRVELEYGPSIDDKGNPEIKK